MDKETKVNYIETLERFDGEVDFSKLSREDLIQLAVRYSNDICIYLKNIVLFNAQQAEMLQWLCEKNGIDVKKKRQEVAKLLSKQLDEQTDEIKEQIKQSVKN